MKQSMGQITFQVVLLGLGILFLSESFGIAGSAAGGTLAPAAFPKAICGLLLALVAMSIITTLARRVRTSGGASATLASNARAYVGTVGVALLLVLYTAVLEQLGYVIATSTLIFVVVSILALLDPARQRKPGAVDVLKLVAFSVAVAAAIFFIFTTWFGIVLPAVGWMGI
ncbi:tripartite tricarboxylate transporter TctB family protein [Halomonas hibernica]|uniref:tripartite tricarboxylate transporter TctB family protein n=1 Tax=Halomonas hibernica TaxID=2591147 RepID=UPI0015527807|nr:tripartite tricarboxylate transporter TctB family protein [Halomonas hibernica]